MNRLKIHPTPEETFTAHAGHDLVRLEHEHPFGFDSVELPEEDARRLRDWLTRWLDDTTTGSAP